WRGKYFSYDRVSIWPRPLQQPHPPILLPADSEEGLEIAASRRVPTGSAYRSTRRVLAPFDRYRELSPKHRWTPRPHHLPPARPRPLPPGAARVRGGDERARPCRSRAPPRLFLAQAPQLSPRLDGADGAVATGSARTDREGRRSAAVRVRLRSLPAGRPVDRG